MHTKRLRLLPFLLVAVTITAMLTSCKKGKHDYAALTIHWSEAPADTTTTLLIYYTDTLQTVACDTLDLEKPKGTIKLRLYVPQGTTTSLLIRPTDGHFVLTPEVATDRSITLRLPLAHPSLAQVKGYEGAKATTRFIKQEEDLLRAYDEAVAEKDFVKSDSLYRLIEATAAHFVIANADRPGVTSLANRYFMNLSSVERLLHTVGDSILPDTLARQNMLLHELSAKREQGRFLSTYRPLSDTIHSIREQYQKPDSCLAVLLLSRQHPAQALIDSLAALRQADSLPHRKLYTISLYPREGKAFSSDKDAARHTDSIPDYITLRPLATQWYYLMERNAFTEVPYYVLLGTDNRIRFATSQRNLLLDTLRKALCYSSEEPDSLSNP